MPHIIIKTLAIRTEAQKKTGPAKYIRKISWIKKISYTSCPSIHMMKVNICKVRSRWPSYDAS